MLWLTLLLIGLAIAFWQYGRSHADEVMKFLCLSLALVGLMAGLVTAPELLKLVILAALVIYPTCSTSQRVLKPNCPKFCLLRKQCKPSHHSSRFERRFP